MLSGKIVTGLKRASDSATREWFTNYVKGTDWYGCKAPVIKQVVRDAIASQTTLAAAAPLPEASELPKRKRCKTDEPEPCLVPHLADAVVLLKHQECDAKLAGMFLLQLHTEPQALASVKVLEIIEREVLAPPGVIDDWSTADWFSLKVGMIEVQHSTIFLW